MILCHSLLQSLCSLLVPQGTYYSWTTWATWRETLPNTYYITSFKHILFKRKGLVIALNGTLNSPLPLDHTSFHASPISSCSYLGEDYASTYFNMTPIVTSLAKDDRMNNWLNFCCDLDHHMLIFQNRFGVVFVLLNDTWSQYGYSVSCMICKSPDWTSNQGA